MKELLVEVVNNESNVAICLCKLVKLRLGNAADVKQFGKYVALSPNSSARRTDNPAARGLE